MQGVPRRGPSEIAERLRRQAAQDMVRVTLHGHHEMVEEDISYDELREALLGCQVIEDYPYHQRGACCLVCGRVGSRRFLHVVCTTTLEAIVVITVYEPKPPKWVTPFQRGVQYEL